MQINLNNLDSFCDWDHLAFETWVISRPGKFQRTSNDIGLAVKSPLMFYFQNYLPKIIGLSNRDEYRKPLLCLFSSDPLSD